MGLSGWQPCVTCGRGQEYVPDLHWSAGRRPDRMCMMGGTVNDGTSEGGRLGVEAEHVAEGLEGLGRDEGGKGRS